MLTLVCATDFRYFNFLKQLLGNVIPIINSELYKDKDVNLVVYDLGMKKEQLEEIKQKYSDNIILETFDFSLYPEHVSLEKYYGKTCSYAWKPIIIYDVCEKYGDLVYWMDTRNLYRPQTFIQLSNWLLGNFLYSPTSNCYIHRWTHTKCQEYMEEAGAGGIKYGNKRNRNAATIGINYNKDWCKDFIKEWKDFALIKECICPEGSDRSNHRQDQAVFSILYCKYQEKYNFRTKDDRMTMKIHSKLGEKFGDYQYKQ